MNYYFAPANSSPYYTSGLSSRDKTSSASSRPSTALTRASSTKGSSSSASLIRRSRIPGHRRTASTDSSQSGSSHEIQPPLHHNQQQQQHHHHPHPEFLHSRVPTPSAAAPVAGSHPADERLVDRRSRSAAGRYTPAPSVPPSIAHNSRLPASSAAYQSKQLPATPRLDGIEDNEDEDEDDGDDSSSSSSDSDGDDDNATPLASNDKHNNYRSSIHYATNEGQSRLQKLTPAYLQPRPPTAAATDKKQAHHAAMPPDFKAAANSSARSESLSSASGTTLMSTRTMMSSEPLSSVEGGSSTGSHHQGYSQPRATVVRSGRTYLADPSLVYPLPVDLTELHRQSLRTLLLFQLFSGPVCSPAFANRPPTKVLEVGCGSGFWSMMCHRYYSRQGHPSISFTGIDLAPVCGSGPSGDTRPDKDMKWRFVQHDLRKMPWPLPNEEFDLIMVKDMSLAMSTGLQQYLMDEYLRMLRPGGVLEIWESDHTIRMLRPHLPESASGRDDDDEEQEAAASLGAYVMTSNTPLSAPLNNYVVEFNGWLAKALDARSLSPVPCTYIGPMLLQESEDLTAVGSRRLAVPLSEIKWEREGVGGVVTKDGKSYIETSKGKGKEAEPPRPRSELTAAQAALRRTALLTVVQLMQSLEPLLRDVSGKSQDEWDGWLGKMMNDLMKENGTSWGECLEVGAWWARKKK